MSQIENVITTTFRARGGQAIAEMGSVTQGFGRMGQVINENSRLSERLNSQWRALGTTIRYAIAGTAVFGLTRLVTQLKDVQQQLGLMQAIGQPAGGGTFSDTQINRLGSRLRASAVDALTPVNEINDAVVNFLSTVQGVDESEIPQIVTNIGQAAKLSQTPIEDLTKSVTTMNVAFGRKNNFQNISEVTRMWYELIKTAPGGIAAAPQIAQQMPSLATMFMLAPGRHTSGRQAEAQLMNLTLGAVRTGAPPSVALRGLTYLLQSIAQPTGGAVKALGGIGITPQSVQEQGIRPNLMKLLRTITHTGNLNVIKNIPDEQLEGMTNLPGIPAQEMTRLRQMVPRIHGIRAAIILASQLQRRGNVESLDESLKMMQDEQDNTVSDAHSFAVAWQNFRKRSQLQEASVAINSLGLQVAQMFEPVMNLAARGVTRVQKEAQRHPDVAKGVTYGLAGAFALAMAGRALNLGNTRLGKVPGLGRILGGGGPGQAFVAERAFEASISGNRALGASPQNPMYVTVVGQLFNSGTGKFGRNTGGRGGGAAGDVERVAEDVAAVKGAKFGWRGLRGLRSMAGAGLRKAAAMAPGSRALGGSADLIPEFARFLKFGGVPVMIGTELAFPDAAGSKNERDIFSTGRMRHIFGPSVTGRIVSGENIRGGTMHGHAEVWLTLNIQHPGGKITQQRVHVPLDRFKNGSFPSKSGKPGSQRSH